MARGVTIGHSHKVFRATFSSHNWSLRWIILSKSFQPQKRIWNPQISDKK